MSPMGSTPQLNGKGGGDLGVATWFRSMNQIGPYGPLTYIGLHTKLWVWSSGTVSEGVRYLRPPGLWAGLYYMLIDHI